MFPNYAWTEVGNIIGFHQDKPNRPHLSWPRNNYNQEEGASIKSIYLLKGFEERAITVGVSCRELPEESVCGGFMHDKRWSAMLRSPTGPGQGYQLHILGKI